MDSQIDAKECHEQRLENSVDVLSPSTQAPSSDTRDLNPLEVIARFVSGTTIGEVRHDVKREASRGVIDFVGVAMAGATHPAVCPFAVAAGP